MAVLAQRAQGAEVRDLEVSVHTVPLEQHESDATLEWDAVTCVVVHARAGDEVGLGYTYGSAAVAELIHDQLREQVVGVDALSPQRAWARMQQAIRNAGQPGVGAMAVSAVDVALWDLKARLLGVSLADLLGRFHDAVPVYGSGGFTSYSRSQLQEQLAGWVEEAGIPRVKIKVGREPGHDGTRLAGAREAIGTDIELFVDANGAFTPKQALHWAERYREFGVTYFEEPVSSEDREGLRFVRDRGPAGMAIAAGEYAWGLVELRELAGCVDVLQADVTRCGGVTSMLRADAICKSRGLPFSAHCAPSISAHVCAAMECTVHLEYFHDHVLAERTLFDGTLDPADGALRPDPSAPGLGLELKR
jgi:L-alanine-DL-glutamate epimerase-like enolase superfamily enzyme